MVHSCLCCTSSSFTLLLSPSLHPSSVLHQLPQLAPSLQPSLSSPPIASSCHQTSSAVHSFISSCFDSLSPSLPCSPLFSPLLNIPFNMSLSLFSLPLSIPPSRGEMEWVLMLVNYSCVEGINRALDRWLCSSIAVNKKVRTEEEERGVLSQKEKHHEP